MKHRHTSLGLGPADHRDAHARSELLGRDAELKLLRHLVAEVAAGRGGSVWMDGEPGIGKSALLTAGLADVEQVGCQLYAARADETGTHFPLRVLLNALDVRPEAAAGPRADIAARLWPRDRAEGFGGGDSVAAPPSCCSSLLIGCARPVPS